MEITLLSLIVLICPLNLKFAWKNFTPYYFLNSAGGTNAIIPDMLAVKRVCTIVVYETGHNRGEGGETPVWKGL